MEIKVLGPGCARCKSLERITIEAVADLGIEANITKEEDIMKIMEYGIMRTPGLVIDNKVILSGRLPSKEELMELINNNLR